MPKRPAEWDRDSGFWIDERIWKMKLGSHAKLAFCIMCFQTANGLDSTAASIAEKLQLPEERTEEHLRKLVKRRLVREKPGNPKIYELVDPGPNARL